MAIATKTYIAKEFLGEFPKASYREFIEWTINHNVDSTEVLGNAYYRKLQKKSQEGAPEKDPETIISSIPVYEMRDIKSINGGPEGSGFAGMIYVNGAKAFEVRDDGWGAPISIHPCGYVCRAELEEFVQIWLKSDPTGKRISAEWNEMPNMKDIEMSRASAVEIWIEEAINRAEEETRLKSMCKTSTLVLLKTSKPGEYLKYKLAYNPVVKAMLNRKHGAELVEIINERYL
jgi:hypothetical protein